MNEWDVATGLKTLSHTALIDRQTAEFVENISNPTANDVYSIAYRPDGKQIAAASSDGLVRPGILLSNLEATRQDLSHLHAFPLNTLNLTGPKILDLSPLRALKLESLTLTETGVKDPTPIADMPLMHLYPQQTPFRI